MCVAALMARTHTQLFERKTDALDFRKNFNPLHFSLAAMEFKLVSEF